MLYFPTWKKLSILAVCLLGILFAMPNLLGEGTRGSLPGFMPAKTVNLGLDLQGGAHLLVEAEVEDVFAQRMETLALDTRAALREAGVTRRSAPQPGIDTVSVNIPLEEERAAALEALEGLAQPVQNAGLGVVANDLDVVQDGATITMTLTEPAKEDIRTRVVAQSVEVIRRRIDPTGTTEATVQRQGSDRVLVQVPGAEDAGAIKALIGDPAVLSFHTVDLTIAQEDMAAGRRKPGVKIVPDAEEPGRFWAVSTIPLIKGEEVVEASPGFSGQTGEPVVNFRFSAAAGKKFGDFTLRNVGAPFAIVLDGEVLSAPVIREPITGGQGQISGSFTTESATLLAVQISAGALPADLVFLEERTVGPELGADSIKAGQWASIFGFVLVMIFMIVIYGRFGVFADIALMINVALIFGVLSGLGATLTLPGIAGVVLTIGMAVDANVLIFERIREELSSGKSPTRAITTGYEKAYSAIIDANITTLIAAMILYAMGSGPVRGFAVTLGVGIITSVFTAVFVTRLMIAIWYERKRPKVLKVGLFRLAPEGTKIGFVRLRSIAAIASAVAVVASLALFGVKGLNYGVDFRGGAAIETRMEQGADIGLLRSVVGDLGVGDVAVQEFGDPRDALIRVETPGASDQEQAAVVASVTNALETQIEGLEVRRVEAVGPKVSGELVQAGIIAVLLAVGAVLVYIWLRFEWQFAAGAVLALAHDVALTIGIFSLLGLEFNLSIIAAILTIVGYSLNDTVVVYDRVRENLRKYKSLALGELIDLSLNETLSRTLMTSITTLLALLSLYILGGEVIRGFTFAMIWGVIIGTYSSIYVASPLLMRLGVKRDWSKETGEGPQGVTFGSSGG